MLKKDIISGCVKTSLTLDTEAVKADLAAANLVFNTPEQSKRGMTHQYVEDVFIRGGVNAYFFQGDLEPDNDENNPALEQLPTIKHFLKTIPGTIGRAALLSLDGESVISIHRDTDKHGYFKNTLRFHAPIITYDEVRFFNEGQFYQMRQGEVWAINNLGRHGVINDNPERRLHLVFDVFINDDVADYAIKGDTSLGKAAADVPELLSKLTVSNRKRGTVPTTNYDETKDLARLMELQKEQMAIMERIKQHREAKNDRD